MGRKLVQQKKFVGDSSRGKNPTTQTHEKKNTEHNWKKLIIHNINTQIAEHPDWDGVAIRRVTNEIISDLDTLIENKQIRSDIRPSQVQKNAIYLFSTSRPVTEYERDFAHPHTSEITDFYFDPKDTCIVEDHRYGNNICI